MDASTFSNDIPSNLVKVTRWMLSCAVSEESNELNSTSIRLANAPAEAAAAFSFSEDAFAILFACLAAFILQHLIQYCIHFCANLVPSWISFKTFYQPKVVVEKAASPSDSRQLIASEILKKSEEISQPMRFVQPINQEDLESFKSEMESLKTNESQMSVIARMAAANEQESDEIYEELSRNEKDTAITVYAGNDQRSGRLELKNGGMAEFVWLESTAAAITGSFFGFNLSLPLVTGKDDHLYRLKMNLPSGQFDYEFLAVE